MNTDQALQEAIKQVAEAKIAEALGGDVLGKIIRSVMDHRSSSYNRDSKTDFENIVHSQVRAQIEQIVREQLVERRVELKKAIADSMAIKIDDFATTIVDAFVREDWRADLTIKIVRPDD